MEGQKILVFGDGRHLFRTIRWVLEYQGYCVSLAPSPGAALVLLIEQNYDLVIAQLRMEDRQGLDVLKRARKLNSDVKLMVVSGDLNVAFSLETYRIEVDDYLLLPITPSELVRRVGKCLGKVLDLKATEPSAVRAATRMNEQLLSLIMMMFHDIRGSLVSTAASLKLLKRGKYGGISSQAVERLQELSAGIKNSTDLIDEFAHEILAGHGQGAASNRRTDGQHDLLKSVPKNLIPELRQSAETIAEPS